MLYNMNRSKIIIISKILIFLTMIMMSCSNKNDLIKNAFEKYNKKYLIYINKSHFALQVINNKLEAIESYSIGFGKNPDKKTKMHVNDNRTPEGEYHITEILSMDADKNSPGY